MAHHQGMSLLSIANFLDDQVVQRWFHSHPRVQATELLLQEKPAAHVGSQRSRAKVA
jgi:cyclic beta-1,2-glucan synthetase